MPSLDSIPAEILLLIQSYFTNLEDGSALGSTCRNAYLVWKRHRYRFTNDILHIDALAASNTCDLADLQASLETKNPPLSEAFILRVGQVPRWLDPIQRHLYANTRHAESACKSFEVDWSGQGDRGPYRLELGFLPHEKVHFFKAFYNTIAFVVQNYAKAHLDVLHPTLLDPDTARLDLSLLNLWKIAEMAEVLQAPNVCKYPGDFLVICDKVPFRGDHVILTTAEVKFVPYKDMITTAQASSIRQQHQSAVPPPPPRSFPPQPLRWLDSIPEAWDPAFRTIRETLLDRRAAAGFGRSYPTFDLAIQGIFISWFDEKRLQDSVLYMHPGDEEDLCFESNWASLDKRLTIGHPYWPLLVKE